MQAKNITIGNIYHIKLGKNEVQGEVVEATDNGWNVRLLASDKILKVNNADRFIRKSQTIATTGDPPVEEKDSQDTNIETEEQSMKVKQTKRGLSAIDAAHKVLVEIGTALTVRQIAEAIIEKGYSPNLKGLTPHLTISSALQREVTKGSTRFYKAGKGLFGAINYE